MYKRQHEGGVTCLTFNPINDSLLSNGKSEVNGPFISSGKSEIKVWNTSDWSFNSTPFAQSFREIEFSPDGKLLLLTGRSGNTRLVELGVGKGETRVLPSCWNASLGPDKKTLATCSGSEITIWGVSNSSCEKEFQGMSPRALEFSHNGRFAFAIGPLGVVVFEAETGRVIRRVDHLGCSFSFINESEMRLFTVSRRDEPVRVWDLGSDEDFTLLGKSSKAVPSLCASHDGRIIATKEGRKITVWNSEGKQLSQLNHASVIGTLRALAGKDKSSIRCFALDSHGGLLASADDRTIKVWNVETGEIVRTLNGLKPSRLEFCPTTDALLIKSLSDIHYWNFKDGRKEAVVIENRFALGTRAKFGSAGRNVIFSDVSGHIRVWNIQREQEVSSIPTERSPKDIRDFDFHPELNLLAIAIDGKIELWDTAKQAILKTTQGAESKFSKLAFLPNSNKLISIDHGLVTYWNIDHELQWEPDFAVYIADEWYILNGKKIIQNSITSDLRGPRKFSGYVNLDPFCHIGLLRNEKTSNLEKYSELFWSFYHVENLNGCLSVLRGLESSGEKVDTAILIDLFDALGTKSAEKARPKLAIYSYERLREIFSNLQAHDGQRLSIITEKLAKSYFNDGQTKESIRVYREALKAASDGPNASQLLMNLANALEIDGKPDESIAILKEGLKLSKEKLGQLNSNTITLGSQLGNALKRAGQYKTAIEHLETALSAQVEREGSKSELAQALAFSIVDCIVSIGDNPKKYLTSDSPLSRFFILKHETESTAATRALLGLALLQAREFEMA